MSPEAWDVLPLELGRFMDVGADPQTLESSWLALALQEGVALKRRDWSDARLVLKATSWGALVWPLLRDNRGRTFT